MKKHFIKSICESMCYLLFGLITLTIVTLYFDMVKSTKILTELYIGFILFYVMNVLTVILSIWYSVYNLFNIDKEYYLKYLLEYKPNIYKTINEIENTCFITFLPTTLTGLFVTLYVIYV